MIPGDERYDDIFKEKIFEELDIDKEEEEKKINEKIEKK